MLTSVVTCADCPGVDRSAAAGTGPASDPAQVAGGLTGEYADILADTFQLQHLDCDTQMEKDVGFNTGLT